MDKINFDIKSNFSLYVNESINQISIANKNGRKKHYIFSSIFGGIAVELGLALIVNQGMNKNIFSEKRVFKHKKIKKIFEDNLDDYVKKSFEGYTYKKHDPEKDHPEKTISIKTEILEKEILVIKEIRNNLVHNNGKISSANIENCLFRCLLFLNLLLPEKWNFKNILNEKTKKTYLEKSSNEEALKKISNAFEIIQSQDNDYNPSLIEEVIYNCIYCGYNSMVNISGHNEAGPGYLCLLCAAHGYLEGCALCGKLIQHGNEYEWNDEYSAYVCEDCHDRYEYKLSQD